MQIFVTTIQIVAVAVAATLGVLLLINILRLRSVRVMNKNLRLQIEEGTDI